MKISSSIRKVSGFPAFTCAPGGGKTARIEVPFYHASAEFPETDLEALLITGDLQFYDREDVPEQDRTLMGHIVCQEIAELCDAGVLPGREKIGVVLTGDLYAPPCLLKRGGIGDVTPVWHDFAGQFRWVTGVAGNHDHFDDKAKFTSRLRSLSNVHPLHGNAVELDGLSIAGISGINGNPRKPWRYTDEEWIHHAKKLFREQHHILALHQGPRGSGKGQRGEVFLNNQLEAAEKRPYLIACGHSHWDHPHDAESEPEVLNVDGAVALLTREGVELGV